MKEEQLVEGETYINIKNKLLYTLVGVATHSETFEPLVVYQAQYDGRVWVRPYRLFLEKFDTLG